MSLELIREVETLYTMPCPLNMQAFHKYAASSKDGLSRREFKLAMLYLQGYKPAKVRIPALPCHVHASKFEMQRYFPDRDRPMSLTQFELIARGALSAAQPADELKLIFLAFDRHGRGFISLEDMLAAARDVAPGLGVATLRQAFEELDPDRDGRVSYSDFLRFLGVLSI